MDLSNPNKIDVCIDIGPEGVPDLWTRVNKSKCYPSSYFVQA